MRRGWIALVAVLVFLAAGSYGVSSLMSRDRQAAPAAEPAFAMLHNYLNLTAQQRQELAGIDARFAARRPALRQRVWDARDGLVTILHDPKSTRSEAVEAARRFSQAREAMALSSIEYVMEVRDHLTPAQKIRLGDMMDKGICAFTGGPGMGRGSGCGGGGCGLGMGRRGGKQR